MLLNSALQWIAVVTIAASAQAFIQPLKGKGDGADITIIKKLCLEDKKENNEDLQVVCSHVQSLQEVLHYFTEEQLLKITTLTLTQSNFSSLSVDDLVKLPSLNTIIFNQSLISNWKIPKETSVPHVRVLILNDCWNNYELQTTQKSASLLFTSDMFDGLHSLEQLHLVKCFVSNMTAETFKNVISLKKLLISNGSGIGCEPYMEWLMNWIDDGKAEVANDTECFVPLDTKLGGGVLYMNTYFSLDDLPFLKIMGYRKETAKDCPKECEKCAVEGFTRGRETNKEKDGPIINIYCSNAGLTQLPEVVPTYSRRLTFAHNKITDISPLFTNERYRHITSIRLEHNNISHLDGDLFFNFLKDRSHDLLISLTHNNLTTFPVKQMMPIYEEAKENNNFKPIISLAHNPWDCSNCDFLPGFQEFVYYQYYNPHQQGKQYYHNIRCAEGNDITAGQMVIKLDVQSLCVPDPPLLQPIDYLNISLGLLIVVFIANFMYNFYQYRQHSKLPWIITKVPCC